MPDTVETVDSEAFRVCEKLTSITIPDAVTEVANFAFEGCSALQFIVIPDSVFSIGMHTFQSASHWSLSQSQTQLSAWQTGISGLQALKSHCISSPVATIEECSAVRMWTVTIHKGIECHPMLFQVELR